MYLALGEAFTFAIGWALIQRFRAYPDATTVALLVLLVVTAFGGGSMLNWKLLEDRCGETPSPSSLHYYCVGLSSY